MEAAVIMRPEVSVVLREPRVLEVVSAAVPGPAFQAEPG
jgi:hypothetical protein